MGIKFGCTVWTLMEPEYHAPYETAIKKAAEAGFDGIELMISGKKELEEYWTDEKTVEIKQLLRKEGLELISLCMFQNLTGGLASTRAKDREEAVENFRKAGRLAKKLGTEYVNFPAPYAEEAVKVKTTATPPEYFYLNLPDMIFPGEEIRGIEDWRFDAQFRMYLPENFDWDMYWENFIENMKRIEEAAQEEGVRCRVENRYNTMLPHTDTFLRMFRRVGKDRISVTFHTAQAFIQREILPWAVHKYGRHLTHVRACDGDGLACYNLPPGMGISDWKGILEALKEIGYSGYISVEWLNDADKEENVKNALAYLKSCM